MPQYDMNVEPVETPGTIAGTSVFCVLYCAVSFGMLYFAVTAWKETVPILITGFFAAFGVVYVVITIRQTLSHRKFGIASLLLERPAPSIGGQLRGSVSLPATAASARTVEAELTCWKEIHEIGRNKSTHREPVWATKQSFPIRAKPGGASATIGIEIPGDLEPTNAKPRVLVMSSGDPPRVFWWWELRVTADVPGVDLDRHYPIVVLPAQPHAAPPVRPTIQEAAPPAPASSALPADDRTEDAAPAKPDPSSTWVLIAANLAALAGAVWWGWAVQDVVFLYWLENLVIGAANILRILLARPDQSAAAARGLSITETQLLAGKAMFAGFFFVHYGAFCVVHGEFLLTMFPGTGHADGLFAAVKAVLREQGMIAAVLAIVASHCYSFLRNYVGRREYEGADFKELMTRPYKRIFVTHIFIIAGGFVLQAMKLPLAALVIFMGIKIAADAHFHRVERNALASPVARQ